MLILLSSTSYRLRAEQLAKILATFRVKAGTSGSIESIDASPKMAAKEIWSLLGARSLFATKRLIVISGLFDLSSAESKELVKMFKAKELPESTSVVVLAQEPLPAMTKQPLVAFCKKSNAVKTISVAVPSGSALSDEIIARAQAAGVTLAPPAARSLVERVVDFDQLLQELDKLILYALSKPDQSISSKDIVDMTSSTIEADIFGMLRALSQGKRAEALRLLHQQLAAGSHPLYILAMLRYQFRSLMLVAQAAQAGAGPAQIQQNTGLSPYVIRTMQQTLERYSVDSIRRLFNKLINADEAIKTSSIDGDVALDLLVLAMSA